MKKLITLICTFTLLLSFSGCGIEKPDLEQRSTEKQETSASGSDIKPFKIEDSFAVADLSDSFHVDAEISGYDVKKLSNYQLAKTNLTEDSIAEKIMPAGGYKREEKNTGAIEFSSEKEKLSVQLVDMTSMRLMSTPNLTYSLDKGKEYESVLAYINPGTIASDEDEEKAAYLVRDKLDKLGLDYDDLYVQKADYEDLNNIYSQNLEEEKGWKDQPAGTDDENSDDGEYLSENAFLYSQGLYEPLDENFKFTPEDDVYVLKGRLLLGGLHFMSYQFFSYDISAAVSSRGIEYLKVENLYSTGNPYGEAETVSAEQAVDALFKAYEQSPAKDNVEVTVDHIELTFLKQTSFDNFSSEALLTPSWWISYTLKYKDSGEALPRYCHVSAADGKIMTNFSDSLFERASYEIPS